MSLPRGAFTDGAIASAYQLIFQNGPSPLAVVAPGRPTPIIARANTAFDQMFGPAQPVAGRRIDQVFRGAASRQVTEAVERCLADGSDVRLRIADAPGGEVIRIEVRVQPLTLPEGARALVGTAPVDVAGKLAELGEEGVLAELGALSRGVVYMHDVHGGRIRYGPHPLVSRLGLPSDGVVMAGEVVRMLHPDDLARFRAYGLAQIVSADEVVSRETFRVRGAHGQWLWVNLRSRVFARNLAGEVQRVIGVATDLTADHNHRASLVEASRALANAEQNERRRIGRELHDATSQSLVAARLSLGALARRIGPDPSLMEALEEARGSIAEAQKEIRNLSYLLHPPSLEDGGLPRALTEFASGFGGRTGLKIHVAACAESLTLSPAVELALFRIAQEALMNVYRHAGAQTVTIRLKRTKRSVILEIEDDGVGLPDNAKTTHTDPGVGIAGMRARMLQLGGSLMLGSDGKGLLVQAVAPITHP